MSKEVADEYMSSLADLTMNSKPLINMLTILAEENIGHAAVIVRSVERHLEKVRPEHKLPALYLVDSIIKNVGSSYTQLFSHVIVNVFCQVFKQVDERIRTQMFKLRETWHDVFPPVKLYQLDVKVNLIDPAWPIQAQPPQINIHVNPNFLKKPATNAVGGASASTLTPKEEEMRNAVALKEQELVLLQKKKVEMELVQAKKLLEQSKVQEKKTAPVTVIPPPLPNTLSSTVVAVPPKSKRPVSAAVVANNTGSSRTVPANPALVNHARRRDPRLARNLQTSRSPEPIIEQTSSVTNNKLLQKHDRINRFSDVPEIHDLQNKSERSSNKNVSKKDPRVSRSRISESSVKLSKNSSSKRSRSPNKYDSGSKIFDKKEKSPRSPDSSKNSPRSSKLPPIPKIKLKSNKESSDSSSNSVSPSKRKKEDYKTDKLKIFKSSTPPPDHKRSKSPSDTSKMFKLKPFKYEPLDINMIDPKSPPSVDVTFKELKISKERNYIRRNREKSESPEKTDSDLRPSETPMATDENLPETPRTNSPDIGNVLTKKDVDLRVISKCPEVQPNTPNRKRPSLDKRDVSPPKKAKCGKFDPLFGNADIDQRQLPLVENLTPPPAPIISNDINDDMVIPNFENNKEGGWAKVKEVQSPQTPQKSLSHLDIVRAKLAEATKGKDPLGRPLLYNAIQDENIDNIQSLNVKDTDMRHQAIISLEKDNLDETIKCILTQTEEQRKNGIIDNQQYNMLLMQVLQLHETKKLKEAQQQECIENSKRKHSWKQKRENKQNMENASFSDEEIENSPSPHTDESDDMSNLHQSNFDIDERVVPLVNVPENGKRPPLLPRPDVPFLDSDLRMGPHGPYDKVDNYIPRGVDTRFPGRPMVPRMYGNKIWRGMRPRMDERGGFRPIAPRGLLPPPIMNARRMPHGGMRIPFDVPIIHPQTPYMPNTPVTGMKQMPLPVNPYASGKTSPPPLGISSITRSFSPVDPKIIEYISQDIIKAIHIDGISREIRYYEHTAVIMNDWDDAREIYFEAGQRRIFFDDESFILNLNDDYANLNIDGHPHRVRIGAPTRELYIDDSWYECVFGNNPISIMLDNKMRRVKLEGPPPQVIIGKVRRTDLVAGKIHLIVDATTMIPIFLDAKLQKFEIENVVHSLRFVDSLQTVLINEKPFKVEFGGLPKPLFVGKRKHFVRFSVLPRDVKPGQIYIKNMEGKKPAILPTPSIPTNPETELVNMPVLKQNINIENINVNDLPIENLKVEHVKVEYEPVKTETSVSSGLDILASLLPSSMAPPSQYAGYSVANPNKPLKSEDTLIPGLEEQNTDTSAPNISSILQNKSLDNLLSSLVASGVLSTITSVTNPPTSDTNSESTAANNPKSSERNAKSSSNAIKPVDLLKSDTLKTRQPDLIALLHTGMQCGSCGARFPPEHTVRYSQHLDWHFRQNRADRHSQRRPNSRRWYYDISDWIQYQEIEDLEEREKSWFEREQQAAEAAKSEEAAAVAARRETSSVPLPSGAPPEYLRCHLCHDNFHQFYNHDTDEWNLRNAVEFEGNNYHPICLDDHKASVVAKETEEMEESKDESSVVILEKEHNDTLIVSEGEDVSMKDPEASTEIPSEENPDQDNESVVEVLSEEAVTQESTPDDIPDVEVVEEDDDVVIKNEPIEQIVLDDDADTDEETLNERQRRDAEPEIPIDFANVKIKEEPIDPDDEPIITSEGVAAPQADTTHAAVLSSIDGNVQLEPTTQTMPVIPVGGIKINITKPLIALNKDKNIPKNTAEVVEPTPPGEEPEISFKLKPSLEGVKFNVKPPTQRGSELSGLCSIM